MFTFYLITVVFCLVSELLYTKVFKGDIGAFNIFAPFVPIINVIISCGAIVDVICEFKVIRK